MWGLIGNKRAVDVLSRAAASGALAHAYLFVGPERVGKATLALRLAQALNCASAGARHASPLQGGDAEGAAPCGECPSCVRIAAGIHADVRTVTVEVTDEGPQRKAISVEQMREVERAVALAPFEGRTRVVIVDPADEMTAVAQNAFLKTLEEPPPHVVFVLIATQGERLLPTVRSRCRRIDFRLLPASEIERALESEPVDPERARLLARLSRGRIGWALAMARDPSQLERRREALQSARSLAGMPVAQRMELAEQLTEEFRRDREKILSLLAEWQGWWRDVLLAQSGAEDGVANVDLLAETREDARGSRPDEVIVFVQALGDARQHLQENVQPRLALEAMLMEAPGGALSRAV